MSYSVDWIAKRVTVPLSDLTLVSGSNYTLSVAAVHTELRRLEWAPADGLWAPYILNHFPTLVLSGIPKTRTIEMVNGYTWDIDASNITVSLTGIDANLFDTFVPANGVSLLGNNSVGKQDTVSAVSTQNVTDIKDAVFDELVEGSEDLRAMLRIMRAVLAGKVNKSGNDFAFRDIADSKDRVSSTTNTDGERTSVTTDGT